MDEGYPLGACMYEWPDVEMAEIFLDAPYFWEMTFSKKVMEWARTPAKAI
jgi:hypothetical protein